MGSLKPMLQEPMILEALLLRRLPSALCCTERDVVSMMEFMHGMPEPSASRLQLLDRALKKGDR